MEVFIERHCHHINRRNPPKYNRLILIDLLLFMTHKLTELLTTIKLSDEIV